MVKRLKPDILIDSYMVKHDRKNLRKILYKKSGVYVFLARHYNRNISKYQKTVLYVGKSNNLWLRFMLIYSNPKGNKIFYSSKNFSFVMDKFSVAEIFTKVFFCPPEKLHSLEKEFIFNENPLIQMLPLLSKGRYRYDLYSLHKQREVTDAKNDRSKRIRN